MRGSLHHREKETKLFLFFRLNRRERCLKLGLPARFRRDLAFFLCAQNDVERRRGVLTHYAFASRAQKINVVTVVDNHVDVDDLAVAGPTVRPNLDGRRQRSRPRLQLHNRDGAHREQLHCRANDRSRRNLVQNVECSR